jgi:predicted RNase H-like HicB family nuclease
MKDYHINVFYSDEDGCYVADIPDLEFCSAFGDTPEEAVHEVMIAKQLWLDAARELGKTIPPPCYTPESTRAG